MERVLRSCRIRNKAEVNIKKENEDMPTNGKSVGSVNDSTKSRSSRASRLPLKNKKAKLDDAPSNGFPAHEVNLKLEVAESLADTALKYLGSHASASARNKAEVNIKKENEDMPTNGNSAVSVKGRARKQPLKNKKVKSDGSTSTTSFIKDMNVKLEGPKPLPKTGLKYVGCHVSASGGIWKAFENAALCGAQAFALFLRNQRSWNAKPLDDETVKLWKEEMKGTEPHLILPHGSYLMNLGSPKEDVLEKSRALFIDELSRCERLGIPHYNFHPGSSLDMISREECCKLIAESINLAHEKTEYVVCVIENMSKQGFTVGGDFHEIRLIIDSVKDKSRVGVCLDTCHSHAAGYDLSTEDGFNLLIKEFGEIVGWHFLRGVHLNDSKGKAGDHKDRHENIGLGKIGSSGFRRIMNCPHFNDVPLILETPCRSDDTYAREIKKLQSFID